MKRFFKGQYGRYTQIICESCCRCIFEHHKCKGRSTTDGYCPECLDTSKSGYWQYLNIKHIKGLTKDGKGYKV
jgi:hypothetical protein